MPNPDVRQALASILATGRDPARKHPDDSPAKGRWVTFTVRSELVEAACAALSEQPAGKFRRGDRVRKISGSAWSGRVVGEYSTALTLDGYAVESDAHPGSVQIYPAKALELSPSAEQPASVPAARPLEWGRDGYGQWTDAHHGFSILLEEGDDDPYSASWGEDDATQFATLEEAQAWCQQQIDDWVARHVVLAAAPKPEDTK